MAPGDTPLKKKLASNRTSWIVWNTAELRNKKYHDDVKKNIHWGHRKNSNLCLKWFHEILFPEI